MADQKMSQQFAILIVGGGYQNFNDWIFGQGEAKNCNLPGL